MNEYLTEATDALREGRRVEIDTHQGQASATLAAAQDNARRAAEANRRGEYVVRVFDGDGERVYEFGADRSTARDLIKDGATYVGPAESAPR